jgi:lysophospholipase L1-like esterase
VKIKRLPVHFVSLLTAASLIAAGLTTATPAHAAGQDLVISMSADNLDPAVLNSVLQDQISTLNSNDDWRAEFSQHQMDVTDDSTPQPTFEGWGATPPRFAVTSVGSGSTATSTLTITVPASDVDAVHANMAEWVQTLIAASSGFVAGTLAAAVCFVAFAPLAPAAGPVCGAVYTAILTFTWMTIAAYLGGKDLKEPSTWGSIMVGTIVATVGGAAFGYFLAPWATANLRPLLVRVFTAIGRAIAAVASWIGETAVAGWRALASVFIAGIDGAWGWIQAAGRALGFRSVASTNTLRVLPFGDSITWGYPSSDGGGYRCELQNYLTTQESTLEMVGSGSAGPCTQNKNEGHSGWTIAQLSSISNCTITGYRPNVVLLDIGTNDLNNGGSVASAVSEIQNLINKIFADRPSVTVLVGALIPTTNSTVASKMRSFNLEVSAWVADQKSAGKHIRWVDMGMVKTTDLQDGLHPNDAGYQKMAFGWTAGIDAAVLDDWIDNPGTAGSGCAGSAPVWMPQGVIASGPGNSSAAYPGSLTMATGDEIHYADISGDGKADFIKRAANGTIYPWVNGGSGTSGAISWLPKTKYGLDDSRLFRFADMNGDGRADLLKVDVASGAVTLYRNDGDHVDGGYDWNSQGQIASGVGGTGSQLRFADINGDGRADYLNVASDSSVTAWLNGGQGTSGWIWSPQGKIASGIGAPGDEIRFADVNGDGRADYLRIHANGAVTAYLNPGLSNLNGGAGWIPQGQIASGVGVPGSQITLADLDNDKKADYVDVNPTNSYTRAWKNGGAISGGGWNWISIGAIASGASNQIKFADLNADGKADYINVRSDGTLQFWYNGGPNSSAPNGWVWTGPVGLTPVAPAVGGNVQFADINGDGRADFLVVDPTTGAVRAELFNGTTLTNIGQIASGVGGPGSQIRFADITGDGKADYLNVASNSSVTAWQNGGQGTSGWIWYPQGTIATGVGAPGNEIRFSTIYGSGKADYVVLGTNGAVQAWRNGGKDSAGKYIWYPQGQIASGVGSPGSQIQFADITGGGRADYLDVSPTTGATRAWLNNG